MKKIVSFLVICLLLCSCSNATFKTIMTNEAISLMEDGAVIVDVRTPDEYNREHIPNAINIPLDSIDSFDMAKDVQIIVYCQTGIRSKEAIDNLIDRGYTTLYNLDGGLLNWGGELVGGE